jgi:SAM-dependent methyltransferase
MAALLEQSTNAFPNGERSPFAQYDRFALIYDTRFGTYARRVVPALERLLLCSLPAMAPILDVCCGTGQLAAALMERGFIVTGIDGSREMLRLAQRNAPQARFLLDDVRTFHLPEGFDAAVSTFDSINYILEPGELKATFANVYRALRPGGWFVFDMNMEEGYRRRWEGALHGVDDGCEFAIRAIYCPETKLGRIVVTWLPEDSGGSAPITFVERCYTEREVRKALTAAGFHGIEIYDGHRDLALFGEIGRSFFVCRKSSWVTLRPVPEPHEIPDGSRSGAPQLTSDAQPDRRGLCPPNRDSPPADRQRLRGIPTCVRDAVWPDQHLQLEVGLGSLRLLALEEVLSTLPPEPYQRLKKEAARFQWFIPSDLALGQIHPFRAVADLPPTETGSVPWVRVVYLSPLLEQQEWTVVVTVIVHELAHVILGHQVLDLDRDTYGNQEEAVRQAVRKWGFQVEADQADEHLRNPAFNRLLPPSQAEAGPLNGDQ